ncbi:MAG: NDP-sugar synthase [Deltaproteobacteria bacterium]|nr:NDP-sugar synthase [Deltaproteobacteria bacterium]
MKAMVLAAGLGKRLQPFTEKVPKPLFPVLGAPVVEWALRRLKNAGVSEVVINLHHLPAQLVRRLASGARLGVNITWSDETFILGTGGGLSAVRDFFAGEEAFLVHNGDVFHDWDLSLLVEHHRRLGADATLALVDDPARPDAQLVELEKGRVVGIRGKPEGHGGPKFVFSGVSVLSPSLFEHLPPGVESCLVTHGIIPLLASGKDVAGRVMDGRFCDIGTPGRFLDLQWDLLEEAPGLYADVGLDGFRVGPDGVILGPGALLDAGARVGPRAVVCEGARIGSDAAVEEAVVFPGVQVDGEVTGIVVENA